MTCDWCGKTFSKYPSKVKRHNFCSRKCQQAWASKRMHEMNEKLNGTRMTEKTRRKIRKTHLARSSKTTYEKHLGKRYHRLLAEKLLGRKLIPGEVVHHVDGNIRNNVPWNIMVLPSSSEHAKLHARLRKFWKGEDGK